MRKNWRNLGRKNWLKSSEQRSVADSHNLNNSISLLNKIRRSDFYFTLASCCETKVSN
jgi:endonuclease I